MMDVAYETIIDRIKRHEGFRKLPYKCTKKKLTIGYGFNLEEGITREIADAWLGILVNNAIKDLEKVFTATEFRQMGPIRIDVLVNMMYNLGFSRFKSFKKMIKRIKEGDYERAAAEMIDSAWAMDVGDRATELAGIMKAGDLWKHG